MEHVLAFLVAGFLIGVLYGRYRRDDKLKTTEKALENTRRWFDEASNARNHWKEAYDEAMGDLRTERLRR